MTQKSELSAVVYIRSVKTFATETMHAIATWDARADLKKNGRAALCLWRANSNTQTAVTLLYVYAMVIARFFCQTYVNCTPKKCTEKDQRPAQKMGIGQQEKEHNQKHQTRLGRELTRPEVYTVSVNILNIATALNTGSLHKKDSSPPILR